MKQEYNNLIENIGEILELGRKKVYSAINSILVKTYWEIGKNIVEFEQKGNEKADYGSSLLDNLSKDLKIKYGKGFSRSNVYLMRLLYFKYPIFQTVSGKLSWSHFVELLIIDDDLERSFYEKQCEKDNWSVRELKRQINSALFYRIALSKDKKGVLELSQKGQIIEKPEDLIKDPYVLEFLKIPENEKYSEKDLEQKIIDNLQYFLLELGKGFSFIGRQFRISLGGEHFFVDLVFYNIILKCFVLIDLKIGKATYQDVGQMNLYLNYFKKEEMKKGDNEPVGIILSAYKNDLTVEYALGSISNKLFVSKYKTYLPDKKELENKIRKIIEDKI
ncbi:MAG: PDDEXK nuclease domain-containing protein [Candidatus Nanoarchaeia archaeon]|nr:PDDEXK nuclease domain-containing protein [Candidatus Nanoarchaeia archaeon]